MKVAIFSDVHANLPALETFIERTRHIGRFACLGDTVGYGPWPDECAVLVMELCGAYRCEGNHERLHLGIESIDDQLPIVRAFYRHTRQWFTRTDLIEDLPESFNIGGWVAQHQEAILPAHAPPALVGHDHRQLRRGTFREVIHVGSVGQSRSAIDRAEWAEMDLETCQITLRSEPYDFERLLAEMRSRQYPDECIDYYTRKPRATP